MYCIKTKARLNSWLFKLEFSATSRKARARAATRRRSARVAISHFVHALNQITCLLKFNRQEVSCRDVDALQINADLIGTAGSNLIDPKCQTIRVRRSIEKVVIVLANKVGR